MASKREGGVLEPGRSWRSELYCSLAGHSCWLLAAAPELPFFPKEGRSGRGTGARLGQSPPPPRRSRPRFPRRLLPPARVALAPPVYPGLAGTAGRHLFHGQKGFLPGILYVLSGELYFLMFRGGFCLGGKSPISRCKLCPFQKA